MTDTVKDQEPDLPHVFPPDTEYHLSSIFVDVPRPAVTPLPFFYIFALSMNEYMNIQSHGTGALWDQKHLCAHHQVPWPGLFLREAS